MISEVERRLPQSDNEWLAAAPFRLNDAQILGNSIKYALLKSYAQRTGHLAIMVGGIPRDAERQKRLPVINKLYGLAALHLQERGIDSLMYHQRAQADRQGIYLVRRCATE